MDFHEIPKIETPDFYLDLAFSKAKKKAEIEKGKKKRQDRVQLVKDLELVRLRIIRNTLYHKFESIMKSFPNISKLPEFYFELVKITIEYDKLKKSLGGMKWARDKVDFFYGNYSSRIKRSKEIKSMSQYRREFYGRISSVTKQVKRELEFLENARRIMKDYPLLKEDTKTIAIAGFPNVGKTTLLKKLTKSSPEISTYPFTTKSLNLGYAIIKSKKVQFIDTPGTLNRLDKMNDIEKQAYLVLKLVADEILYIFDITEPYPLKDQIKLLKNIRKYHKNVIVYLSKSDVINKDKMDEFLKKQKAYTNIEDIKKEL